MIYAYRGPKLCNGQKGEGVGDFVSWLNVAFLSSTTADTWSAIVCMSWFSSGANCSGCRGSSSSGLVEGPDSSWTWVDIPVMKFFPLLSKPWIVEVLLFSWLIFAANRWKQISRMNDYRDPSLEYYASRDPPIPIMPSYSLISHLVTGLLGPSDP